MQDPTIYLKGVLENLKNMRLHSLADNNGHIELGVKDIIIKTTNDHFGLLNPVAHVKAFFGSLATLFSSPMRPEEIIKIANDLQNKDDTQKAVYNILNTSEGSDLNSLSYKLLNALCSNQLNARDDATAERMVKFAKQELAQTLGIFVNNKPKEPDSGSESSHGLH